ncbi:hypothetical protein CKM354_000187700 [Cercospora kikuchii]|uniref:Major facilitator superfamily (MFS) profile domain-containing protein n=1 Tax=Cercospora kikuchii TaxID=84275 RepID=A0A9P3FDD7_9PEZI|nr:uncharacterized protein CKM354_000187700 [Cercospora kikuchii]GIZ38460.1 hypothetical protein CKM354_000187700 [Cercospora kikuchii]
MSRSSASDLGKEAETRNVNQHSNIDHDLTTGQKELIEAAEPPFTERESVEKDGQESNDLERVATKASSKPSVNNIKSVPNGGLWAWLQVVSSFFLFMNTWGIVNTFGTYQTYYETGLLSTSSPSAISWIGSIQATLLLFVGSLTGPIYDSGYARSLVFTGTFLVVFGQMMLSLSTTYYQVILSQAICIGIGTGCLFIPCVAVLSTYFSTRIATAVGLAAAGSSIGGVVYPIVFYRLQPAIGFAWTTRVLGFLELATLGVSCAVLRIRVLPAGRRKFLDLAAWKEVPFTFFVLGTFIGFLGLYTPFFYIQSYALALGTSPDLAFYLLAILNAASTFGRVLPNLLADRIGPFNVIIPCTFMTGILCLCLVATDSFGSVAAISALYGFFSGTFVSLPATIYVHITANRGLIGTRMGMGFSVTSIGILVGTPISGAILGASGYNEIWIYGGIMTIVAAALICVCRVSKGGWGWKTVV